MAFGAEVLTDLPAEDLPVMAGKIHDGDILLCAAHDPFSRLIGWSTKSPWSHVAIAYRWPSMDRILAFEAVQRIGVHAVSLDRFISQTSDGQSPFPGDIILARHDETPERGELKALADFMVDRMGDRYSVAEILRIAARVVVGRLNRQMPQSLKAKDEFICSEYVAAAFDAIGVKIPWDGRGFIAPADFALDPKVHAVGRFRTK
jgi:hypothetical protein